MRPPKEIFKAYDIRGIVDQTLTVAGVTAIGRAIGSEARERGLTSISIGRDGRLSGPTLSDALAQGLKSTGLRVVDVGMVATPMLYYAAHTRTHGSGIMVTGSHNPPEYNGLKMMLGGETLSGSTILSLHERLCRQRLVSGSGTLESLDISEDYLRQITDTVRLARPMKIVVDSGNGIPGRFGPELYRRMGCTVVELFCDVDGHFPNHHPDPSQPENLQDLILALKQGRGEYAGARLLEILSRFSDPGAVLDALPDAVATPELQIRLQEGENFRIIATLQEDGDFPDAQERITLDGLRIEYADGFGLARSSNTTPVIVLRFEAEDAAALARIQQDFKREILKIKPEAIFPY